VRSGTVAARISMHIGEISGTNLKSLIQELHHDYDPYSVRLSLPR
jgi:hypothetical protein